MAQLRAVETGWMADELRADQSWIHVLSASEIAEIEAAIAHARSRGLTCATLTQGDFPLPTVSALLERVRQALEGRYGLMVMRCFPVERYSVQDLRLMYWGIGLHTGVAVSQSRNGDLLGDVKNFNSDVNSAKGRGYTSKQRLHFHTDSCDVVCLVVLKTAQSGGISMIASSLAIHHEIARTRPDLLKVLYEPYYWSWQEQEASGALPYYPQPIFTSEHGYFSSRYIRTHIESAQRFPEVPRLTSAQIEAMDLIDQLCNEPRFGLSMKFEPGDFQFLNNHVTYHARTEFDDYPEPERRRHLLRMWLSVPNSRPLNASMGTLYTDRSPGAVRGGFPSRVGRYVYETLGWDV